MLRFIGISLVLSLLIAGCTPVTPPTEKITLIELPEPYVSKDFGANDYLPLAVGNEWKYRYVVKYEGARDYVSPGSYESGKMEWSVKEVRKYDDSTEEFTISTNRQDERGNLTKDEFKVSRSPSLIIFDKPSFSMRKTMPRQGTTATYIFESNNYYGKGIGLYYQFVGGGHAGGPGAIGAWKETLEVVSRTIKQ